VSRVAADGECAARSGGNVELPDHLRVIRRHWRVNLGSALAAVLIAAITRWPGAHREGRRPSSVGLSRRGQEDVARECRADDW